MFAMLLAITWTFSSCAAIPVAAMYKARTLCSPVDRLSGHVSQLLNRGLVQVALRLQEIGDLGVAAGDLDQARHFNDPADVGFFDVALHQCGVGGGIWCDPRWRKEVVIAVLLQTLRLREIDQNQP